MLLEGTPAGLKEKYGKEYLEDIFFDECTKPIPEAAAEENQASVNNEPPTKKVTKVDEWLKKNDLFLPQIVGPIQDDVKSKSHSKFSLLKRKQKPYQPPPAAQAPSSVACDGWEVDKDENKWSSFTSPISALFYKNRTYWKHNWM